MCLPDFIRFEHLSEAEAVVGYRNWRVKIKNGEYLISESQNYAWPVKLVSHEVKEVNSGIYAYNNYYNNYNYNYNYNYYNNNYNYNYNNNYNNNYNIAGIIKQFGRVAIHEVGYRSEFAVVDTLFTIRELDAIGDDKFKNWIKLFNKRVTELANKYEAKTMHYQDFMESIK